MSEAGAANEPDVPVERVALERLYGSRDLAMHQAGARALQMVQQLRLPQGKASRRPRVVVSTDPGLPSLAWMCRIRARSYRFVVGSGVETCANGIVEGVWDGPFAEHGFDATDYVYGSGATWRGPVVFVPPKHAWECLYVLHDKQRDQTFVSNSVNFVFAEIGMRVPGRYFSAVTGVLRPTNDLATAAGFDRYDPLVLETDRFSLHRMIFHNFCVGPAGSITVVPTQAVDGPTSYTDYVRFLRERMGALFANGNDSARARRFDPMTPLSAGYDSPAVAVLARELGARRAVTITSRVKGKDDSGVDIGRTLGLDVEVVDHVLGPELARLASVLTMSDVEFAAEFVATAGLGDDVMLRSFESHLPGSILLSGAFGDAIWRRACRVGPGLPVGVLYGKSFTEFRLRVGYSYVPVPAIGARFVAPIRAVTRSAEMAPWTLNQPYDRPIARRLIEEAGVERGSFARSKAAMNPAVSYEPDVLTASVDLVMDRYRPAIARMRAAEAQARADRSEVLPS